MGGILAEHTAAVAAISYMESEANTMIKDLNYDRLKQLEENKSRRIQLRKADTKGKKLARGWFLSARHRCSFSSQSNNLTFFITVHISNRCKVIRGPFTIYPYSIFSAAGEKVVVIYIDVVHHIAQGSCGI